MSGGIFELGADKVVLKDTRYCEGCLRNPVGCSHAYYSRVPNALDPNPIGTYLTDWRRGDGCPLSLVQETIAPSATNSEP